MKPAILRGLAPGVLALFAAAAAAQTAPAPKPIYPLKASAAPTPFQGVGDLHCQLDSPGSNPALMLFSTGKTRRLGFFADQYRPMTGNVQAMITYPNGITDSVLLTRKGADMLMVELTPQMQSRLLDNIAKPGKIIVRASGTTVEFPLNDPAPAAAAMRGCVNQLPAMPGPTATTTVAAPQGQPIRPSDAKRFADARQWDNAINAALTSTDRDKLEVLLAFAGSSINDSRRWPGQQVVLANMRIFDDALRAASPDEQRRLIEMRQGFYDYMRQQAQAGRGPVTGSSRPGSSSSTQSTSVRTAEPQRCYQVSRDRQVCYN